MNKLMELREKIDQLDQEIMYKLNQRFSLMEEIGAYKRHNNLPTDDEKREMQILAKTANFPFAYPISSIYHLIIQESKYLQTLQTYLVGKSLPYTYSDEIHYLFGNPYYQILETNNFDDFIKNHYFYGINITNPYKQIATKYADTSSEIVKLTGVTNLLVRQNDQIHAENVDYDAFIEMLKINQIDVQGLKVIVVGNGATSKTVALALKHLGAAEIIKLVRTIRDDDEYLIEHYLEFKNFDIIVNTTSYGVKPNYQLQYLFPLDEFVDLKAVVDVNYNPYRTPLIQEALKYKSSSKNNVIITSGLSMLVAGARKSVALWMKKDENLLKSTGFVTKHLLEEKLNLVLIGMPYSGKTTVGKKLASIYRRPFLDTDEVLRNRHHGLESLINQDDFLNEFRKAETETIKEAMASEGYVIATGGGAVERVENMKLLSQSGIIIYLNIPLEELYQRIDGSRVLIDSNDTLKTFYEKRHPLYLKYADIVINDYNNVVKEIMVKVHEYFNN